MVILHKTKDSREQNIELINQLETELRKKNNSNENITILAEDTIVKVGDTEMVDIRWTLKELEKYEGETITWITNIGTNDGETINIYQGIQQGIISLSRGSDGFAFDPYLIPIELYCDIDDITLPLQNYTLSELETKGLKDLYSARTKALVNLRKGVFIKSIKIKNILKWNGEYQND